jgi:hypothetical protein
MGLKLLVPIVFHLLPLAPLFYQRWAGAVAALLLIVVPYVKNKKLTVAIDHIELSFPGRRPDIVERELAELRAARRRWRALTLPWLQPARD